MKTGVSCLLLFFILSIHKNLDHAPVHCKGMARDTIPPMLSGNFTDDYGIRYTINDSLWIQYPKIIYHIIKWNTREQYFVARNDEKNRGEAGLYTRIDYMSFSNMEPFRWGFCFTAYDAKTDSLAEVTAHADRQNPKKGCNGFPFSRMKRTD